MPGASPRRRRRGNAGRARGSEPRVDRLRAARRSRRGGLAARGRRRGDRDGARLGAGADRRRDRKRPSARLDTRDGRADRSGSRSRRGARDRCGRRLGDDRRRARSRRGAAQALPRARPGRLRRADTVRRRGCRLRSPEGRDSRAGRGAVGAVGRDGGALPRRVRRRRLRRCRDRERRAAWRAGSQLSAQSSFPGSHSLPRRSASTGPSTASRS